MRSDYGLYVVAIICFVIAIAFAGGAVQGYTLQEAQGLTVTVVFLVLGIISGAVGYSARPKAMMPAPPISAAIPTPTPEPKPEPAPAPVEVQQRELTPSEPSAPLAAAPETPPEAETSTPAATVVPSTEPMPEPEQPVTTVEEPKAEEVSKEKPARRRRRKAQ